MLMKQVARTAINRTSFIPLCFCFPYVINNKVLILQKLVKLKLILMLAGGNGGGKDVAMLG